MPRIHKDTKSHKVLKFKSLNFSEILCFSDLVAKKDFSEWTQDL